MSQFPIDQRELKLLPVFPPNDYILRLHATSVSQISIVPGVERQPVR
jgi:hypothetical protein